MLAVALGAAAALFAVAALLLLAAGRARAKALATDVRTHVEPYLRRKAAEAGLPGSAPTWTSRTTPEEVIAWSTRVAARLLEHDKGGSRDVAEPLELARTQPVSASDEIVIRAGHPSARDENQSTK